MRYRQVSSVDPAELAFPHSNQITTACPIPPQVECFVSKDLFMDFPLQLGGVH
jgi:hypothetical protein